MVTYQINDDEDNCILLQRKGCKPHCNFDIFSAKHFVETVKSKASSLTLNTVRATLHCSVEKVRDFRGLWY